MAARCSTVAAVKLSGSSNVAKIKLVAIMYVSSRATLLFYYRWATKLNCTKFKPNQCLSPVIFQRQLRLVVLLRCRVWKELIRSSWQVAYNEQYEQFVFKIKPSSQTQISSSLFHSKLLMIKLTKLIPQALLVFFTLYLGWKQESGSHHLLTLTPLNNTDRVVWWCGVTVWGVEKHTTFLHSEANLPLGTVR